MSEKNARNQDRSWLARALLSGLVLMLLHLGASPLAAQVVINEIDYDQAGTDAAEFIELRNNSGAAVNLAIFSLQLVNGNGATVYNTIALPSVMLGAGDYFVICGDAANVPNCDLDVSPNTNLIQNGAPDAAALFNDGVLIDAVSYEGNTAAPFTETSGVGLVDASGLDNAGISRFPDGVDTDVNNVDLSPRCSTPGEANLAASSDCVPVPPPMLVINEVDYDQPSTDTAEFVEIKNIGAGTVNLAGFSVQLVNGTGGGAAVYNTINLPAVDLFPGAYFVVCGNAANVNNCDLDASPDSNLIQNGAPDAVALFMGTTLLDTVSYEGDTGAPFTEGSGVGLADSSSAGFVGISRSPDGNDTDSNNVDFIQACITPGASNASDAVDCGPPAQVELVINEIDYDQPSTDAAEFIEILNSGTGTVDLSGISLQLVNGNGGAVYNTINLPAVNLGAGEYFVVCGNAANVFNCDLDVTTNTNLIQNGAPDAVALFQGGTLLDTVSYEGDTAAPFTEGTGVGLADSSSAANLGISRFPDGTDTGNNASDLSPRCITPGFANTSDSSSCPAIGAPELVINEVDYDQSGTDSGEFVEIKNVGVGPVALGGFSVQVINGSGGGASVARTIVLPSVTLGAGDYFVVCGNAANVANCDLDVTPDTNLIQNGAPDAVALFQGTTLFDTVSYEGDTGAPFTEGSGVGLEDDGSVDFSGISRLPDGNDTDQNNVDFAFVCITPGTGNTTETTSCSPQGPTVEIFEIQGAGLASPFDGQNVTTADNVVTAVSGSGFFIQTPISRSDGDPETSDGIFVFTGAVPSVSVGDTATVSGQIVEFFNFTEFGNSPSVTVTGTGAIPAPVLFDAATPSPNQPQPANDVERFEGMLVEVVGGTVVGPSNQFGDAQVVAGGVAPVFREPGIEFPGQVGLPEWDGNPEAFELNPDGAGLPDIELDRLTTFSAVGALAFSFGDFQLWPTSLTIDTTPALPAAVRDAGDGEFQVGTLNMFRLFDSEANFGDRLLKFSAYIRDLMKAPHILAVQEVGDIATLTALANQISSDDPAVVYTPFLEEGNDVGGIDVGFLVREETIQVQSVTQIGAGVLLTFDGTLLNDRPPLVLEAICMQQGAADFPLTVIAVHQRSLNGIEGSGEVRVRQKRHEQALFLAQTIQDMQTNDPDVRLVVLGDFNAFEFTDGYVDVLGQVTGNADPLGAETPVVDIVDPPLANNVLNLGALDRYTFNFGGNSQVLDHVLTSSVMTPFVSGVEAPRANTDSPFSFGGAIAPPADLPRRASDHDGVVLFVQKTLGAALCANLGDQVGPVDRDLFTFEGEAGEEVTIVLHADPDGVSQGQEATFILRDNMPGVVLNVINNGTLPSTITATLPATGQYRIWVNENRRLSPQVKFLGDYCLSLVSSGGAQDTLQATSLVE